MSSTAPAAADRVFNSSGPGGNPGERGRYPQRFPRLPLALTTLLLSFTLLPRVNENPRLVWTFCGLTGALFVWQLILWIVVRRQGRALAIELVPPVKSHYVQAAVQLCIMLYWGWFWRDVYAEMPLIFAQLVFLYIFEALVTWSRGRPWRPGFGPLPIIFSTNLLLWFRDDWFIFQFLMVATGALGKQFITWHREGRRTHIFNPSAFGQSLFAVVLIATGTTVELTWGKEIAQTFDTPHMLVVIFLGGLVVQYLFHVTLMTFAAVATLCLVNVIYTQITGVYFFVNINIAAPIFLGVHLLLTDPATSPRTNLGRVIFGGLYGLGYCALFRIFDIYEVPLFWDKLLPVPILNLCVPLIDRLVRTGIVGKLNRSWETALRPARLNLVHMGCWVALFVTMVATGFVESPHPGNSIPFWQKAFAEGKPHAGHSLVMAVGTQAEGGGSGAAFNELGLFCMQATIPGVKQSNARAARYFSRACELGNINGCANVAIQFLFLRERRSDEDVIRALDQLERDCISAPDWGTCYLVGNAYETGRGRSLNKRRAIELYERCGWGNLYAAKGLARIALSAGSPPYDLTETAIVLENACERGDVESCWYLAHMHHVGNGVERNDQTARAFLERGCALGSEQACQALKQAELPPFSNPQPMVVPGWSSAYPMPESSHES
jgi:TPR repeat protein